MNYGNDTTGVLIGTSEDAASTQGLLGGLGPASDSYFGREYGRIYKKETDYRRLVAECALAAGRTRRRIEDIKLASYLETLWSDPWDE